MTLNASELEDLQSSWRWRLVAITLAAFLIVLLLTDNSNVTALTGFATFMIVLTENIKWDLSDKA